MEFKQINDERLEEVVIANHEIFNGMYEWPPYTLEQYKERFKGIDPVLFVAEDGEKIIGDCISFDKDGKWYLWILGVDKEFRNQGVATKLFELNEQYAREHGYKSTTVKIYNVSKEMLRLAIDRGYQIVGIDSHVKNMYNGVVLELDL